MFTFMQAIEKLPASVVSGPLSDPEKLRSILKHHMVHGKYCLTNYPATIVSVQVSLLRAAECIISQIINCADSIVLSWAFPASEYILQISESGQVSHLLLFGMFASKLSRLANKHGKNGKRKIDVMRQQLSPRRKKQLRHLFNECPVDLSRSSTLALSQYVNSADLFTKI